MTDPLFIEKVRDVVGLYLDPPERPLVLCVDEKSQIQTLETTTLFAALDVATGNVKLDVEVPDDLDGSTRSSAGSGCSSTNNYVVASTNRCQRWKKTSAPGSPPSGCRSR